MKRSREYHPHHTLLGAAYTNLELAERKEPGWHYFELAAILFSGLAVEALANSFGSRYVTNWKDYESSSPIAKLQIVSTAMGVDFDEQVTPWSNVRWLVKFRNRLAHAKPELVLHERNMTDAEWDKARNTVPESKLEIEVSPGNAKRAVDSAYAIRDLLGEKIPDDDFNSLLADGWSSNASAVIPNG
mgnify:CR=1 FL=1